MSIEFPCSQCGKLLRVGDDAAGKQARCPSCGTVQAIPHAATQEAGDGTTPQSRSAQAQGEINPFQAPLQMTPDSPALLSSAQRPPVHPTIIGLVEPIESTWRIATTDFAQFAMCLVVMIICFGINYATQIVTQAVMGVLGALNAPIYVVIPVLIVLTVAQMVFQMWIGIGQTLFFLKTARGEHPSLGILFAGAPYLLAMIVATLIVMLVLAVVAALCGAAGYAAYAATGDAEIGFLVGIPPFMLLMLYLSLTYYQYYFLIPDKGLGAIEALGVSRQITRGNRLTLFGLYLLAMVPVLASVLLCCIPFLFTIPFIVLTTTVVYLKMAGQVTGDELLLQPPPSTPFAQDSSELR